MKTGIASVVVLLLLSSSVLGAWTIQEGFEGGVIPAGWTVRNVNADAYQWTVLQHGYAHSGTRLAMVECRGSNGNDWLITPPVVVTAGDSLIFYARAWYGTENFNVKLSTTGTAVSDFTVTLASVVGQPDTYHRFAFGLGAYAGSTVHLAIQWQQDVYALIVDDFRVGKAVVVQPDVGLVSIDAPLIQYPLGAQVYPAGTVRNFGLVDIVDDVVVQCEIKDASSTTVYSASATHSGTLTPGSSASVAFTSPWVPSVAGNYTVALTASLVNDGFPGNNAQASTVETGPHHGTGGADTFGYRWIDSTEAGGPAYNWIEISGTGTSAVTYGVPSFGGGNNFSERIPIGFPFPFYGLDRDSMYVDVNGEILLAASAWLKPYPSMGWDNDGNSFNFTFPIPGYPAMPALVAPYWDDLIADAGVGDVYFQTFGAAPSRYCVIEWRNLRFGLDAAQDPTLTFEVVLFENGDLLFQYQDTGTGVNTFPVPHDDGRSATVAIQNDAGTAGLSYLHEIVAGSQYTGVQPPGNMLHDNLAIRFYAGEDTFQPAMVFGGQDNTFDANTSLTLEITDLSGVQTDSLHFNAGAGWQAMTHSAFIPPDLYRFDLPAIPAGLTVEYYFAASDNSPGLNRGTLPAGAPGVHFSYKTLPTTGVHTLFTYAANQDIQGVDLPAFRTALDAAGVRYDEYDWRKHDTYRFPGSYDAVFVAVSSAGADAGHDSLAVALMAFMDEGREAAPKNVFCAADDFAYASYGWQNSKPMLEFFNAYLRGGFIPRGNPELGSRGGTNGLCGPDCYDVSSGSIIGMPGAPLGRALVELPVFANSPDVIGSGPCPLWYVGEVMYPEISSAPAYLFEDGPAGQAYSYHLECGIWLDNLIYKSFFLSFDLGQLTNVDDVNGLVADAVSWFGIDVAAVDEPALPTLPGRLLLSQNYPNPFNPGTKFSYRLAGAGPVTVTVYDLQGRLVRTLRDERQEAGEHVVYWDGVDASGQAAGSGTYVCRLKSGTEVRTRKMTLIK